MIVLDPSIVRVAVAGNVADLPNPKASLARSFIQYKVRTARVLF